MFEYSQRRRRWWWNRVAVQWWACILDSRFRGNDIGVACGDGFLIRGQDARDTVGGRPRFGACPGMTLVSPAATDYVERGQDARDTLMGFW